MLLGVARPAHVVTQSITVRGLVNMSALTVVQAQVKSDEVAANKARATRVK
jgi:malate dehydrogenase (oxaloacetate-decarboxylating)(NADP+)